MTEKKNWPDPVGVPLRRPPLESDRPGGRRFPDDSANVSAPVPPDAVIDCEYGVPTLPSGIDVGAVMLTGVEISVSVNCRMPTFAGLIGSDAWTKNEYSPGGLVGSIVPEIWPFPFTVVTARPTGSEDPAFSDHVYPGGWGRQHALRKELNGAPIVAKPRFRELLMLIVDVPAPIDIPNDARCVFVVGDAESAMLRVMLKQPFS